MRAPRWAVPAAVVVLSVALALGLAAWARGGPRRVITLSEREAQFSWSREDDTALWLTLGTIQPEDSGAGGWVGTRRLAALGMDTVVRSGIGRARGEQRSAFAVLELGGAPFDAWVAGQVAARARELADTIAGRDSIIESYRRSYERGTRLVLVDVGPDAAALAARYPDERRHLILAAVVQTFATWHPRPGTSPVVYDSALGSRVQLEGIRMLASGRGIAAFRDGSRPPRYTVRVATGRGGVPWVLGAEADSAR